MRRYKRFLADVEIEDGSELTVYCPNTGAMTGCLDRDAEVWLSRSDNQNRKYMFTLELVNSRTGLVCVHAARANTVVKEGFSRGLFKEFSVYPDLSTEVRYGSRSRADFVLSGDLGRIVVEVKSVTLDLGDGIGVFPDAVSGRALKHARELQKAISQNSRSIIIFCVLHSGIRQVSIARQIDPAYYSALKSAITAGVEVQAWSVRISTSSLMLDRRIPFNLDL